MNIIGNSCASSYVVRDLLKERFSNPFVWCSVTEADILFVRSNYGAINWNDIRVGLYDNKTLRTKNVKIVVDGKIEIKYPHYCLSKGNTKVDGINVFSKDIIQWATDKYNARVARMEQAGAPFYVLGGSWEDQMMSLSTKYDLVNAENAYILNTDGIIHDNYKVAVKNFDSIQSKISSYFNTSSEPNL